LKKRSQAYRNMVETSFETQLRVDILETLEEIRDLLSELVRLSLYREGGKR
jgi:pyoverdine/dityrosine biosynthesis protein Dit1